MRGSLAARRRSTAAPTADGCARGSRSMSQTGGTCSTSGLTAAARRRAARAPALAAGATQRQRDLTWARRREAPAPCGRSCRPPRLSSTRSAAAPVARPRSSRRPRAPRPSELRHAHKLPRTCQGVLQAARREAKGGWRPARQAFKGYGEADRDGRAGRPPHTHTHT